MELTEENAFLADLKTLPKAMETFTDDDLAPLSAAKLGRIVIDSQLLDVDNPVGQAAIFRIVLTHAIGTPTYNSSNVTFFTLPSN